MRKSTLFLAVIFVAVFFVRPAFSQQLVVWEASNSVTPNSFSVNDPKLYAMRTAPYSASNQDFMGLQSPSEPYDVFFSNPAGDRVEKSTSCVTIRGQYYGNSATGSNISRVDLINSGVTSYYSVVTAQNLVGGNPTMVPNAVDVFTNTTTQLGNAQSGKFASITVCEPKVLPENPPVDVGCPRLSEDITWAQFQIVPNPNDNNSYTLKYNPTTSFTSSMQTFANSIGPNPLLDTFGIIWSLEDCGTANSCNWQKPRLAEFGTSWKKNNVSGYQQWNPTDFSVGTNSSIYPTNSTPSQFRMKVNNYYMVYSWENLGKYRIKGPCADSDFKIAILRGGPNMRGGEPVVQVENARGKIIVRRPLREIPR